MKICLVGHSASGLLKPSTGGSERQIALLGRELAARGHDVSLVVAGLDAPEQVVDGVRVRCGWDAHRGLRWVRAVTYRYRHLYRVLRAEKAAVYYTRGGAFFTPLVMRAAQDVSAQALLALASDRDLYPETGWVLFWAGSARSLGSSADRPTGPIGAGGSGRPRGYSRRTPSRQNRVRSWGCPAPSCRASWYHRRGACTGSNLRRTPSGSATSLRDGVRRALTSLPHSPGVCRRSASRSSVGLAAGRKRRLWRRFDCSQCRAGRAPGSRGHSTADRRAQDRHRTPRPPRDSRTSCSRAGRWDGLLWPFG